MKKLYYLFLLFSSLAFGQNWETIAFKENIKFDFPKVHTEKDSLNLKIFSAKILAGSLTVTRTIERTHVLSWDKRGVLDIFKEIRNHVHETFGGELISDEVVEFQKTKTAKFVAQKFENGKYYTNYCLAFYYEGHVFLFEFSEITNKQPYVDWNKKFFNEINIANNKPQAVAENEIAKVDAIDKAAKYIIIAVLVLILPAVLVVCFILWRRHKADKPGTL